MKKIKFTFNSSTIKTLIVLFTLGMWSAVSAQITHPTTGTVTEMIGAAQSYTDSGAAGGSYVTNEDGTVMLCPQAGFDNVVLTFSVFDVEASSFASCFDQLTITGDINGNDGTYAGDANDAGTGLACIDGTDGTGASTMPVFTAASGACLTVFFDSDGSVNNAGWEASVAASPTAPPSADPCTLTCPSDMTITLDPGDCAAYVNYVYGLTGDCTSAPAPVLDFTGAFDLAGAFDFAQNLTCIDQSGAPTTLTMSSADPFGGDNGCGFFGTVQQFTVPADGSITFDWNYTSNDTGAFWDPFGYAIDMTGILTLGNIQGSTTELVDAFGVTAANGTETVAVTAGQTFAFVVYSLDGAGGASTATISNFIFQQDAVPTTVAVISGPESGDAFAMGTTSVTIEATLPNGSTQQCSFDVTVNEFPDATNIIATHDAINVSLDAEGCAIITADMVLTGGPYGCYDDYVMTRSPLYVGGCPTPANSVVVGCEDIGTTIEVTILDPTTGNSQWTLVTVEDKLAPTIECPSCPLTSVSGALEASDPTFNRPFTLAPCTLSGIGTNVFYDTMEFDVDVAGTYTFTWNSNVDLYGLVYADSFDPTDACNGNAIALNDDAGPGLNPMITVVLSLTPGHYVLVTTSFANGTTGAYTINVDNAGLSSPEACIYLCTQEDAVLANAAPYATFPEAHDNAEDCWAPTTSYTDAIVDGGDCGNTIITRTWTAEDNFGRTATCDQEITITPVTIADVVFPTDRDDISGPAMDCANHNTAPTSAGAGTVSIGGVSIEGGNGSVCNIAVTHTDLTFDICEGSFKILRTWTLLDWCTGLPATTHTQLIKVLDTTGPVINCLDDVNISTSGVECLAHFYAPAIGATDDCSTTTTSSITLLGTNDDVTTLPGGGYGLPIGTHTFEYAATDACGNTSTCTMTVNVTDDIIPAPVCDEHTAVTLTNEWGGTARVYAITFDDGSTDNCGVDHFEVRRMNTHCNANGDQVNGGTAFGDYVDFCCGDTEGELGNDFIQVVFRVYDINGNFNDCMVEVVVEDKTPAELTCPPNITIDCDDLDGVLSDLGQFGTVHTDASLISPVYNVDGSLAGFDGYAHDNCNLDLNYSENINLDECHSGTITRTWTATDGINGTATCTQVITVNVGVSDFTVVFPADVFINECGNNDDYGYPVVSDDYCELVAIESIDETYDIVPDACYKILRQWKVLNWCVYELGDNDNDDTISQGHRKHVDGGDGYMEHTQIIKVIDNVDPVLTCSPDTMIGNYTSDCGPVFVSFPPTMHDDCTPDDQLVLTHVLFQLDADGNWVNIGQGLGAVSGYYDNGQYKVDYYVSDKCGNTTECWFNFMIVDKKKPTPYCINPTTVVMQPEAGGCIGLWATDFDYGSYDNCTDQADLVFSLVDANGYGSAIPANIATDGFQGWTYCCADIAANGSEVFQLELHVTDAAGNTEYCTLPVTIQANDNCLTAGGITASGVIANENDATVTGVNVTINGGMTQSVVTGANGSYTFAGIASGSDISITPYLNVDPRNGVNTYDLVKIGRHVLETELLDSEYKEIAADANNNGSITGADVVILRQLILFNIDEIPGNTSWRFFDADFNEVSTMNNIAASTAVDFTAVKIGDVTGDASTSGLASVDPRDAGTITFDVDNATFTTGEEVRVEFTSADLAKVLGYQFTLNFDADVMTFDRVEAGAMANLNEANFGMSLLNEGVITTSYNGRVSTDEVLFTLVFTANTAANLSNVLTLNSKVTAAGAYSDNGSYNVELAFNGTTVNAGFELMQNEPNPFAAETTIGFTLPTAGAATLTIRDLTGRVILTESTDAVKGYNSFNVSNLETSGVLYYTVEAAEFTATKKMVIVK